MLRSTPPTIRLIAAFASIYLIWGSTYLAIRFAIESIPPLGMTGIRSLVAGAVLFAWARMRGARSPTKAEWGAAVLVGGLLFFAGYGGLAWAQQRVPSGVAAVFAANIPLFMVLVERVTHPGQRLRPVSIVGIALGTIGVVLLAGPSALPGERVDLVAASVLLLSSLLWAVGSGAARTLPHPSSTAMATGLYLLGGGVLLIVASAFTGEWSGWRLDSVSTRSLLSLSYLIIFGSMVAFGAYTWLIRHASLSAVGTFAYVNPVIALLLGWAVAGEALSARVLTAAALILFSVALILSTTRTAAHTAPRRRKANATRSANLRVPSSLGEA